MQPDLNRLIVAVDLAAGLPFRTVLPVLLIATGVFVVLHLLAVRARGGQHPACPSWNWWQTLVYLGTVISVAILGLTSFYGVLRYHVLDGWLLFAHMFGAGAFTAMLPLWALTWSPAHRWIVPPATGGERPSSRFFWLPKLTFWLILAAGIVVTGTMLLSMLPLFGTEGLHQLLDIHRYSGLIVVIALLLHLYGVALQRVRLR